MKRAKEEGYTEPDPKIDLSGIDVQRKILILARESGHKLELDEIVNQSFLPSECLEATTVDEFYDRLTKHENHFKQLYDEANKVGKNSNLWLPSIKNQDMLKLGYKHIHLITLFITCKVKIMWCCSIQNDIMIIR